MARVARALRWLLLPWWTLQVFTGEKSFASNPLLGSRTLNRLGLSTWRARLAHRMTALRRRKLEHLVSAADRDAFLRDGFVAKTDFAPPDLFRRIVAEVEAFTGRAGEYKEGDAVTRRIPLTPHSLQALPACKALLERPEWRGLTRYVSSFDADPQVSVQAIFTRVDDGARDPQTSLHVDTFHPTMKAWLFLHDVGEDDGPFSYVPGSHLRTPRREAWERRRAVQACDPAIKRKGGAFRITRAELARLRTPPPRRFAVAGNTLVVADTYGFHARTRSRDACVRLEIWASSRRNPFLPWTGGDIASTLLRGRGPDVTWWLLKLRRKLGLPTPRFREVRDLNPGTRPAPWSPGE